MIEVKFSGSTQSEVDNLIRAYLGADPQPEKAAAPSKPPKTEKPAPEAPAAPAEPDPQAVLGEIKLAVPKAVAVNRDAVVALMAKYKVDISKGQKVGDVVPPKQFPAFLVEVNKIIESGAGV